MDDDDENLTNQSVGKSSASTASARSSSSKTNHHSDDPSNRQNQNYSDNRQRSQQFINGTVIRVGQEEKEEEDDGDSSATADNRRNRELLASADAVIEQSLKIISESRVLLDIQEPPPSTTKSSTNDTKRRKQIKKKEYSTRRRRKSPSKDSNNQQLLLSDSDKDTVDSVDCYHHRPDEDSSVKKESSTSKRKLRKVKNGDAASKHPSNEEDQESEDQTTPNDSESESASEAEEKKLTPRRKRQRKEQKDESKSLSGESDKLSFSSEEESDDATDEDGSDDDSAAADDSGDSKKAKKKPPPPRPPKERNLLDFLKSELTFGRGRSRSNNNQQQQLTESEQQQPWWMQMWMFHRNETIAMASIVLIILSGILQTTRYLISEDINENNTENGEDDWFGTLPSHFFRIDVPLSQRGKLKQRSAPRAGHFFSSKSGVTDLFRGNEGSMRAMHSQSEVTLVFYYAPWCAKSQLLRRQIQMVSQNFAPNQVTFVGLNCWDPGGECRQSYKLYTYPVLAVYLRGFNHAFFYTGHLTADYLYRFLENFLNPLTRISNTAEAVDLLSDSEILVVAHFTFVHSLRARESRKYLSFYFSALRMLERDTQNEIKFAVITNETVARDIFAIEEPEEIRLVRLKGGDFAHIRFPANKTYKSGEITKWIYDSIDAIDHWAGPAVQWLPYGEMEGGKSQQIQEYLGKDGPTVLMFSPRKVLLETEGYNANYAALRMVSLEYTACRTPHLDERKRSKRIRVQTAIRALHRRDQIAKWTKECKEFSRRQIQLKKCCHDVVLTEVPIQPHRNICDICQPYLHTEGSLGLKQYLLHQSSASSVSVSLHQESSFRDPEPADTIDERVVVMNEEKGDKGGVDYSVIQSQSCSDVSHYVSATNLVGYCCSQQSNNNRKQTTRMKKTEKPAGLQAPKPSIPSASSSQTTTDSKPANAEYCDTEKCPNPAARTFAGSIESNGCRRLRLAKQLGYRVNIEVESSPMEARLNTTEDEWGFQYTTCYANRTLKFAAIDSDHYAWLAKRLLGGEDEPATSNSRRQPFIISHTKPLLFIIDNATESVYLYSPPSSQSATTSGSLSVEGIRSWLSDYMRGGVLQRHRRSQRVPVVPPKSPSSAKQHQKSSTSSDHQPRQKIVHWETKDSKIQLKIITADNFKPEVVHSTKDVLLFYSGGPWCGACASIFHVVLTTAAYFRGLDDTITFAQIDASRNDLEWAYTVDRYPALIFFPARRKSDSLPYPTYLPVTLPNLLTFILSHASAELRWRIALSVCQRQCLARNERRTRRRSHSLQSEIHLLKSRHYDVLRNADEFARYFHQSGDEWSRLVWTSEGFHRLIARKIIQLRTLQSFERLLRSLKTAGRKILENKGREALLLEWLIRNEWRQKVTAGSL